jgi:hypothetical protein
VGIRTGAPARAIVARTASNLPSSYMRLGSATTKLLLIVFLFPSIAFPNPVFINPAFANGAEVSSQLPAVLDFTTMGPSGSGIAAVDSTQTDPVIGFLLGFSDVASGQDYQLVPAGIGAGLGLSGSSLGWPVVTTNAAPILLDFVAVPNFNFSQIQQGQITAVTLDYESAANSINRAFTFDYTLDDPSAVPEPATVELGALGLWVFGVVFGVRRSKARASAPR